MRQIAPTAVDMNMAGQHGGSPCSRFLRRFDFSSQSAWVGLRHPRLAIPGMPTAGQFFELDHHVLPAGHPSSRRRPLGGHNPYSRPGKGPKRRPIGIGRHDDYPSSNASAAGVPHSHTYKLRHLNLASPVATAIHKSMISRKHTIGRNVARRQAGARLATSTSNMAASQRSLA
jgi:hypothetical protein